MVWVAVTKALPVKPPWKPKYHSTDRESTRNIAMATLRKTSAYAWAVEYMIRRFLGLCAFQSLAAANFRARQANGRTFSEDMHHHSSGPARPCDSGSQALDDTAQTVSQNQPRETEMDDDHVGSANDVSNMSRSENRGSRQRTTQGTDDLR